MRSGERVGAGLIEALVGPPGSHPWVVHGDRAVLAGFFDALLGELPWWDKVWRVVDVGPATQCSTPLGLRPGERQVAEVVVPGSLSRRADGGEVQPFSSRVRLLEDRLLRWQFKVGDMVIGPAHAPVGEPEPHPFGAVIRMLAEMRGLPPGEVARQTGRSRSTVHGVYAGHFVSDRRMVERLALALDLPAADLADIAGLDPADPGWGSALPAFGAGGAP